MPTLGNLVTRTKRLLHSNTRTELDKLDASINTTASPQMTYKSTGVRPGSYLSIGDPTQGFETVFVHAIESSYSSNGNTTVERAMDGSTALSFEDNSLVEIEPRFTGYQIYEALIDAIHSLPENLFAVSTTTVSFTSTTDKSASVTFSNGFTRILKATRTSRNNEDREIGVNVVVQEFGGSYNLIVQEPTEKAIDVKLTYAHPFVTTGIDNATTATSIGTQITTGGSNPVLMDRSMVDLPCLAAASTLMLADESARSDLHAQGVSRDESLVNAGDRARHSLILQQKYQQRVSQEARRLMAVWGVRDQSTVSSVFPAG